MTPQQRHTGQDQSILERRHGLYQQAKERHPGRWSGNTRDWTPIAVVTLNARPQVPDTLAQAA